MRNVRCLRLKSYALFTVLLTACVKTETITNTVTIKKPVARMSIQVRDPWAGFPVQTTNAFIDSNFSFINSSDSGAAIKYKWDFGDGTTSTEKSPLKSYKKRGDYNVLLTVTNDDKASDTISRQVHVMSGQQTITAGEGIDLYPAGIEETSNGDFLLLANNGATNQSSLYQLDSLLKQKAVKALPANYRFYSVRAAGDGNYLFTGNTNASNKSDELVKLSGEGNLIWNKVLVANDSYAFSTPSPAGGYAVVGSRSIAQQGGGTAFNTVVIKTDMSGNIQWQKVLDSEGMINTDNIVAEQDGFVVSGTKRGPCSECDSILVVKLNNSGAVVWKNTVMGAMNNFVWWNTNTTKLSNGNYAVSNGYTRGIFMFSPAGAFLDRRAAQFQVGGVASSDDGNLIVLQTEPGNGSRISVSKMTLGGAAQWQVYPDGRQKVQNGFSCCSSSWPSAVKRLKNGGSLTIGRRVLNTANYNVYTAIVLLPLTESGLVK